MSKTTSNSVSAFAPATVGNIGVGFDILGHAIVGPGDTVTVTRVADAGVRIIGVSGIVSDLPDEPDRNTATRGLVKLVDELGLDFGLDVHLTKGIPLGSGMGGSAASAVAAVVAVNALLDDALGSDDLLRVALMGEELTGAGTVHADNVAPALFGGICLSSVDMPPTITRIPVPADLFCVLVHPDIVLETQQSRTRLADHVSRSDFVRQTSNLAGLIAACYTNDLTLIKHSLTDVLIEPQRMGGVPGFTDVKKAALQAGALGCSLSGSGPSVFAWCTADVSHTVADAMLAVFRNNNTNVHHWISPVDAPGAHLVQD